MFRGLGLGVYGLGLGVKIPACKVKPPTCLRHAVVMLDEIKSRYIQYELGNVLLSTAARFS